MPEVHLTFLDGEVVPVETDLIDFGQPVIKARSMEPASNNDELTIPLSSLKYIVMAAVGEEPAAEVAELGKVVIHFSDHEVLRAYSGRETLGGLYGVIYDLVDPGRTVHRRIGVPYSAVKAIFKVKDWAGRGQASPRRSKAKVASKKSVMKTAAPKKAAAAKKPAR